MYAKFFDTIQFDVHARKVSKRKNPKNPKKDVDIKLFSVEWIADEVVKIHKLKSQYQDSLAVAPWAPIPPVAPNMEIKKIGR